MHKFYSDFLRQNKTNSLFNYTVNYRKAVENCSQVFRTLTTASHESSPVLESDPENIKKQSKSERKRFFSEAVPYYNTTNYDTLDGKRRKAYKYEGKMLDEDKIQKLKKQINFPKYRNKKGARRHFLFSEVNTEVKKTGNFFNKYIKTAATKNLKPEPIANLLNCNTTSRHVGHESINSKKCSFHSESFVKKIKEQAIYSDDGTLIFNENYLNQSNAIPVLMSREPDTSNRPISAVSEISKKSLKKLSVNTSIKKFSRNRYFDNSVEKAKNDDQVKHLITKLIEETTGFCSLNKLTKSSENSWITKDRRYSFLKHDITKLSTNIFNLLKQHGENVFQILDKLKMTCYAPSSSNFDQLLLSKQTDADDLKKQQVSLVYKLIAEKLKSIENPNLQKLLDDISGNISKDVNRKEIPRPEPPEKPAPPGSKKQNRKGIQLPPKTNTEIKAPNRSTVLKDGPPSKTDETEVQSIKSSTENLSGSKQKLLNSNFVSHEKKYSTCAFWLRKRSILRKQYVDDDSNNNNEGKFMSSYSNKKRDYPHPRKLIVKKEPPKPMKANFTFIPASLGKDISKILNDIPEKQNKVENQVTCNETINASNVTFDHFKNPNNNEKINQDKIKKKSKERKPKPKENSLEYEVNLNNPAEPFDDNLPRKNYTSDLMQNNDLTTVEATISFKLHPTTEEEKSVNDINQNAEHNVEISLQNENLLKDGNFLNKVDNTLQLSSPIIQQNVERIISNSINTILKSLRQVDTKNNINIDSNSASTNVFEKSNNKTNERESICEEQLIFEDTPGVQEKDLQLNFIKDKYGDLKEKDLKLPFQERRNYSTKDKNLVNERSKIPLKIKNDVETESFSKAKNLYPHEIREINGQRNITNFAAKALDNSNKFTTKNINPGKPILNKIGHNRNLNQNIQQNKILSQIIAKRQNYHVDKPLYGKTEKLNLQKLHEIKQQMENSITKKIEIEKENPQNENIIQQKELKDVKVQKIQEQKVKNISDSKSTTPPQHIVKVGRYNCELARHLLDGPCSKSTKIILETPKNSESNVVTDIETENMPHIPVEMPQNNKLLLTIYKNDCEKALESKENIFEVRSMAEVTNENQNNSEISQKSETQNVKNEPFDKNSNKKQDPAEKEKNKNRNHLGTLYLRPQGTDNPTTDKFTYSNKNKKLESEKVVKQIGSKNLPIFNKYSNKKKMNTELKCSDEQLNDINYKLESEREIKDHDKQSSLPNKVMFKQEEHKTITAHKNLANSKLEKTEEIIYKEKLPLFNKPTIKITEGQFKSIDFKLKSEKEADKIHNEKELISGQGRTHNEYFVPSKTDDKYKSKPSKISKSKARRISPSMKPPVSKKMDNLTEKNATETKETRNVIKCKDGYDEQVEHVDHPLTPRTLKKIVQQKYGGIDIDAFQNKSFDLGFSKESKTSSLLNINNSNIKQSESKEIQNKAPIKCKDGYDKLVEEVEFPMTPKTVEQEFTVDITSDAKNTPEISFIIENPLNQEIRNEPHKELQELKKEINELKEEIEILRCEMQGTEKPIISKLKKQPSFKKEEDDTFSRKFEQFWEENKIKDIKVTTSPNEKAELKAQLAKSISRKTSKNISTRKNEQNNDKVLPELNQTSDLSQKVKNLKVEEDGQNMTVSKEISKSPSTKSIDFKIEIDVNKSNPNMKLGEENSLQTTKNTSKNNIKSDSQSFPGSTEEKKLVQIKSEPDQKYKVKVEIDIDKVSKIAKIINSDNLTRDTTNSLQSDNKKNKNIDNTSTMTNNIFDKSKIEDRKQSFSFKNLESKRKVEDEKKELVGQEIQTSLNKFTTSTSTTTSQKQVQDSNVNIKDDKVLKLNDKSKSEKKTESKMSVDANVSGKSNEKVDLKTTSHTDMKLNLKTKESAENLKQFSRESFKTINKNDSKTNLKLSNKQIEKENAKVKHEKFIPFKNKSNVNQVEDTLKMKKEKSDIKKVDKTPLNKIKKYDHISKSSSKKVDKLRDPSAKKEPRTVKVWKLDQINKVNTKFDYNKKPTEVNRLIPSKKLIKNIKPSEEVDKTTTKDGSNVSLSNELQKMRSSLREEISKNLKESFSKPLESREDKSTVEQKGKYNSQTKYEPPRNTPDSSTASSQPQLNKQLKDNQMKNLDKPKVVPKIPSLKIPNEIVKHPIIENKSVSKPVEILWKVEKLEEYPSKVIKTSWSLEKLDSESKELNKCNIKDFIKKTNNKEAPENLQRLAKLIVQKEELERELNQADTWKDNSASKIEKSLSDTDFEINSDKVKKRELAIVLKLPTTKHSSLQNIPKWKSLISSEAQKESSQSKLDNSFSVTVKLPKLFAVIPKLWAKYCSPNENKVSDSMSSQFKCAGRKENNSKMSLKSGSCGGKGNDVDAEKFGVNKGKKYNNDGRPKMVMIKLKDFTNFHFTDYNKSTKDIDSKKPVTVKNEKPKLVRTAMKSRPRTVGDTSNTPDLQSKGRPKMKSEIKTGSLNANVEAKDVHYNTSTEKSFSKENDKIKTQTDEDRIKAIEEKCSKLLGFRTSSEATKSKSEAKLKQFKIDQIKKEFIKSEYSDNAPENITEKNIPSQTISNHEYIDKETNKSKKEKFITVKSSRNNTTIGKSDIIEKLDKNHEKADNSDKKELEEAKIELKRKFYLIKDFNKDASTYSFNQSEDDLTDQTVLNILALLEKYNIHSNDLKKAIRSVLKEWLEVQKIKKSVELKKALGANGKKQNSKETANQNKVILFQKQQIDGKLTENMIKDIDKNIHREKEINEQIEKEILDHIKKLNIFQKSLPDVRNLSTKNENFKKLYKERTDRSQKFILRSKNSDIVKARINPRISPDCLKYYPQVINGCLCFANPETGDYDKEKKKIKISRPELLFFMPSKNPQNEAFKIQNPVISTLDLKSKFYDENVPPNLPSRQIKRKIDLMKARAQSVKDLQKTYNKSEKDLIKKMPKSSLVSSSKSDNFKEVETKSAFIIINLKSDQSKLNNFEAIKKHYNEKINHLKSNQKSNKEKNNFKDITKYYNEKIKQLKSNEKSNEEKNITLYMKSSINFCSDYRPSFNNVASYYHKVLNFYKKFELKVRSKDLPSVQKNVNKAPNEKPLGKPNDNQDKPKNV